MSFDYHNRKRTLKGANWSEHEPLPHIYRPSKAKAQAELNSKKSASLKCFKKYSSLLLFSFFCLISVAILDKFNKSFSLLSSTSNVVAKKAETKKALNKVELSNNLKPSKIILSESRLEQPLGGAIQVSSEKPISLQNLSRASLSGIKVDNTFLNTPPNSPENEISANDRPANKTKAINASLKDRSSPRVVNVSHKVESGESLHSIFSKHGLSYSQATKVDSLLRESEEVSHLLKPGQKLDFSKNTNGELKLLNISLTPVRSIEIAKSKKTSPLKLRLSDKKVEQVETSAFGEISSSFSDAAAQSGVSYGLVDDFVDIFASKVRFGKDLRKRDSFSVVFNKNVLEDGTPVGGDELLAAGINLRGETLYAIKVIDADGTEHLVDRNGEIVGNTFLRYPLKFSRISSHYSHSRLHPILKRRKPHRGVDFAAPTGTAIRSVADGRITFAGRKGPNGIMLKVQHGSKYRTAYLHLSKIEKGIKTGSIVTRGQVIGRVGSTGRSTGPHLDFRFYENGKSVNPLKVELPKIDYDKKLQYDKALFARRVQKLDSLMKLQAASQSKNKNLALSSKNKNSKKS